MTAVAAKEITTRQVAAVRFGFYTDDEVKRISVKRLVQPVLMDGQRNPIPGGLYDPAMGPTDLHGRCATCSLSSKDCPGHFGHIELPVPVYNPMIFNMLYRLLRQQCLCCFHLRLDREEVQRFEAKLVLLCSGRLTDAVAMQMSRSSVPKDLAELLEGFIKGGGKGGAGVDGPGWAPHLRDTKPAQLTSLTLEAIRDTIADFFARVPVGKCRNCDAHSPKIKKQGPMKLFKHWASAKALLQNSKGGHVVRSVITTPVVAVAEMEQQMADELAAAALRRHQSKKKKGKRGEEDDKEDKKKALIIKGDPDHKAHVKKKDEEEEEQDDEEEEDDDEDDDDEDDNRVLRPETEEELIAEQQALREGPDDLDTTADALTLKERMKPQYMTPWEVEELLKRLWHKEWRLLSLILGPQGDMWEGDAGGQAPTGRHAGPLPRGVSLVRAHGKGGELAVVWAPQAEAAARASWSMFFLRVLPVTPNKFRPPSVMGEQMFEHPQNTSLQRILNACLELSSIKETLDQLAKGGNASPGQPAGNTAPLDKAKMREMEVNRLVGTWTALQDAVAALMDTTMAANAPEGTQGIRQALEKKEGLFRKNMMGKRVNFAARSVISPDPYIGTGEIGIPPYFAMRLCYPERVTPWNVERLREAVLRGPHELNGAVAVEDSKGRIVNLKLLDLKKREALAKQLLSGGADELAASAAARGAVSAALVAGGDAAGATAAAPAGQAAVVGSNKIVYRHLQDGDLMLTNRQPTLHKPGLMAHRARVLKGEKTIRMHYANCSTFNADFDGDEINLHLPQDHFGRAEGYGIVHADHQFIVPTDGKPIRGLIQDHVVSGVLLTKRDTWLTRAQYQQLVYLACCAWRRKGSAGEGPEDIELEPPAILKPRALWSGKQVVSTVVRYYVAGRPPLTFACGGKVPADYWGGKASGEADLVFHKGYMVSGCVDKNVFGKFGLVHAVQEMYGGPTAGALLSSFSRLFTAYLQWHGFTCGFDDLLLNAGVEAKRKAILARAEAIAVRASAEFVGTPLPEAWAQHPEKHKAELQAAQAKVRQELSERYRATRTTGAAHDMKGSGVMHPLSSEVVKACIPAGQIKPFPTNCLSLMTVSGAKGSLVNFSQISCLLGQQELEGRRVPRMASGATLPCFAPYDGGARSCGFVGDRFLSGLRPQEYYFHCMAGREGLIDTTVKTSRSGYLQRCLIKNLETLRVHYDYTVRDNADGSIVQFYYGDDGLDVTQVSYMGQLGFLASNAARFSQALDAPAAVRVGGGVAGLGPQERQVAEALKRRTKLLAKAAQAAKAGDTEAEQAARAKLTKMLPLMAEHFPSVLACTSEAFMDRLINYTLANPDQLLQPPGGAEQQQHEGDGGSKGKKGGGKGKKGGKGGKEGGGRVSAEEFQTLMCLKYMRALAAPGEAVGVLAGQSIGEPSTQMTLNTFHMAGRGEANVTLGIPRLREILMTAASKIKTPVMTLPLRKDRGSVTDANVLAGRMRRLRLAECLAGISVEERPVCMGDAGGGYSRSYTVHLRFFSPSQFPPEAGLTFKELVDVFQSTFCARLRSEVDKEVRRKAGSGGGRAAIGRVDLSALQGEDEEAAAAGGGAREGAQDEDREGEEGAGARARRRRRKPSEVEDGQDVPADDAVDEEDEEEQDEEMVEGKMRFRGVNDETTYEEPDEEDAAAAKAAVRAGRKHDLLATGDEEEEEEGEQGGDGQDDDEEEDDDEDDNAGPQQQQPAAAANGKAAAAQKAGAKGKKGGAAAASGRKPAAAGGGAKKGKKGAGAGGVCEVEAEDAAGNGGVDYATHTCRVAVRLPLRAPKLLMLEVVERVAAAVMVRETPSIDKVYVLPGERGEVARVQTDGVNFPGVWAHADLVDVTAITTNDVAAMLRTYGVEAARATILREVQSVFAAYGIGVDPRHLGLVADLMTHQGGYRACNRIGIESNVSPFLKMSFETATHFLTDATLRHAEDDLRTPSARLCVGQVVELGTGCMGIVHNLPGGGRAAAA